MTLPGRLCQAALILIFAAFMFAAPDRMSAEEGSLTDAATGDVPIAERPIYRDGDVFEYVDRFQTIACKRWEFKGRDEKGRMVSQCDDKLAYYADESGTLLKIAKRDGTELLSFRPKPPSIPFPLQVGSKWGGKYSVSLPNELVEPHLNDHCEVVAFETVKIAAGELPAFRFVCKTDWSVWPLHGTVTVTSWYAPAARTVVKVVNGGDDKWNMELAHFTLQ